MREISENIRAIRESIAEAAIRSGRKPEDIRIIAVTKTVDAGRVTQAVDCGITDLGENRVQELCDKFDLVKRDCSWHIIGHLQTNKVKYIIDKVSMIHSLDRPELALEIQKRAQQAGRVMEVLVQVNIAEEESKFGISLPEAKDFIRQVAEMPNIKVKGLMTIAPYADDPEELRWVFAALRKLSIDIKTESTDNIDMDYLSMGMSGDYAVAIEE
ncbi:MAG: YggS family pyridoxal phosphate-dependent enzyme, partial [Clostridiales bacterium]|nr:YggS family pyridoxal phosphate-dependent enzyme [Clostridiales bacterium]